jgi:transcriptional regulator with XRE-family HTH domain
MTPAQCRAARGLLDWTQVKLAEAAGLALSTVVKFERNGRAVPAEAVQGMQRALEAAGVEFFAENGSGAGVKFRKGKLN